jgi:hypothetical protein
MKLAKLRCKAYEGANFAPRTRTKVTVGKLWTEFEGFHDAVKAAGLTGAGGQGVWLHDLRRSFVTQDSAAWGPRAGDHDHAGAQDALRVRPLQRGRGRGRRSRA